jgi:hypothetical protein
LALLLVSSKATISAVKTFNCISIRQSLCHFSTAHSKHLVRLQHRKKNRAFDMDHITNMSIEHIHQHRLKDKQKLTRLATERDGGLMMFSEGDGES